MISTACLLSVTSNPQTFSGVVTSAVPVTSAFYLSRSHWFCSFLTCRMRAATRTSTFSANTLLLAVRCWLRQCGLVARLEGFCPTQVWYRASLTRSCSASIISRSLPSCRGGYLW